LLKTYDNRDGGYWTKEKIFLELLKSLYKIIARTC